ncbi:hypothetical protein [Bradyrhizobium sp. AUGA SZCCT0160]|uniref:hypothetical protein n=1 Tax=Bradyrhizobium sp. AUGA SZCCT0160 TaxID=2807662 RepID=UPI001BABFEAC|nr:hypothetical protein [Bradyrhizobium sp. AUGA SZCCT0160]MBR1191084.1 hypothetical protein [Bradyrhizobium sp. AUGA SZCCT0160]
MRRCVALIYFITVLTGWRTRTTGCLRVTVNGKPKQQPQKIQNQKTPSSGVVTGLALVARVVARIAGRGQNPINRQSVIGKTATG